MNEWKSIFKFKKTTKRNLAVFLFSLKSSVDFSHQKIAFHWFIADPKQKRNDLALLACSPASIIEAFLSRHWLQKKKKPENKIWNRRKKIHFWGLPIIREVLDFLLPSSHFQVHVLPSYFQAIRNELKMASKSVELNKKRMIPKETKFSWLISANSTSVSSPIQ